MNNAPPSYNDPDNYTSQGNKYPPPPPSDNDDGCPAYNSYDSKQTHKTSQLETTAGHSKSMAPPQMLYNGKISGESPEEIERRKKIASGESHIFFGFKNPFKKN